MLAALLMVSQTAHAETLYQSSLGPNGGAPYLRTRAQLDAMGGTWNGERFTTREFFPNTSDPAAATFVTQVIYTPKKTAPGR
jgi:hypothetical protein